MATTMPGMMLYFDDIKALAPLDNGQMGALIRALALYAQESSVSDLDSPVTTLAFSMLRGKLDRDRARYEAACAQRSAAAVRSHAPRDEDAVS